MFANKLDYILEHLVSTHISRQRTTVREIRSSRGLAAVDECRNWILFVYRDIKKMFVLLNILL